MRDHRFSNINYSNNFFTSVASVMPGAAYRNAGISRKGCSPFGIGGRCIGGGRRQQSP